MNKGNIKTSSLKILFQLAIKNQTKKEQNNSFNSPMLDNWKDCLNELIKGNTINIIKD